MINILPIFISVLTFEKQCLEFLWIVVVETAIKIFFNTSISRRKFKSLLLMIFTFTIFSLVVEASN